MLGFEDANMIEAMDLKLEIKFNQDHMFKNVIYEFDPPSMVAAHVSQFCPRSYMRLIVEHYLRVLLLYLYMSVDK
ncbi:hypothetical protein L195_g053736 [Trifolium pratense]|uniref:Uncharacterized protein n=1 Tax=Trifolium pratense TaxID=57577 RepID=A0A2K3KC70_TRIPR|nr:hypothetical protein L195_g053736 [Trifolium pratense]